MEENKDQQKLYGFMQMTVYIIVVLDILVYLYNGSAFLGIVNNILEKFSNIFLFQKPIITKVFTLVVICVVGIGTQSKKELDLNIKNKIVFPLIGGIFLLFGSIFFLELNKEPSFRIINYLTIYQLFYIVTSFFGAILTLISIDNISKIIRSDFGKDKWNIEAESFQQNTKKNTNEEYINIPMQFYYKNKINDGYISINPFRATMVIGTPGSGKSFGVINPFIRQMISKEYTICLYDFKFPDLGKIAYYHYLLAKQNGKMKNYKFHVINLNEVEKSNRINPLKPQYVRTLAEASEISEALVESLKKGDKGGGSDAFFTQSAVNFLASSIYFLAKYEKGKYSSLPHLLSFLNRTYEEIFTILYKEEELHSLLSPFYSAFQKKAFDQLEGQIGTLKIFISRLATKESFWVFGDDDFELKISDPNNPSILVLASDPNTQNINSALYSLVLNRMLRLINTKGNKPCAVIADEVPTLFMHKIENVIATARSNKVAVLLGLQELPQFKQQYGKDASDSINSIVGNILSGSVRSKDTLQWLETIFGKVKQTGEGLSIDRTKTSISLNEKLDALIPAGKIASLKQGEMVGIIAQDAIRESSGKTEYTSSAVNCKINLPIEELEIEENNYKSLPVYYDFGKDKEHILLQNFRKINTEVQEIVTSFLNDKS